MNFYICEEFSLFFFAFEVSWFLKKFHIGQIVTVVKFVVVITYVAHFEGKVRNYTATKSFQLNYRRAVRNARRAGRLFSGPLTPSRTALIRDFHQ